MRCAICSLEIEKTNEDIQKLKMLSKTGIVLPDKLIKLLDIYEGPCGEESEHVFSWDIDFLKQVGDLKGRHKGLLMKRGVNKESLDKTAKEIEELMRKLEDIDKVKESLIEQLAKIDEEIPIIESSFEEITGTKELSEWK